MSALPMMSIKKNETAGQSFFITVLFQDNMAWAGMGNDIFVSSLIPCTGLCASLLQEPQIRETSVLESFFSSNCTRDFTNGIPGFVTKPVNLVIHQAPDTLALYPCRHYSFTQRHSTRWRRPWCRKTLSCVDQFKRNFQHWSCHGIHTETTNGTVELRRPQDKSDTFALESSAQNA